MPYGTKLYRHAQPAPERDQVRIAHAEWSQATFGNVGPVGPLKHLSKEALEAAAEPGDLSEWADMQFLLWDAQRRAGITDEQITQAMIEKLAVNKQRSWPEPKDGEPRLHINEQPALTGNFPIIGIDLATGPDRTVEVSYVAPPGYVMVPMRLTAENGAKVALSGEFSETKFVNCSECFGDDECETCDGSGRIEITVPVSWTTIKEIWAKGVEHFAAAPQSPGSEPATVPGKWIPVSERLPETDGNYWGWWSESKRQGPVWFIKSELQAQFQSSEITHWMPLPASPQEVK
ncbi:TPA: dATP/dGTP pyrophosphohydrolase domain-containing protein [Klebsiella quasipneumoniae]